MLNQRNQFRWHRFNVSQYLPNAWDTKLIAYAQTNSREKQLKPNSITSRELANASPLTSLTVDGLQIRKDLTWLFDLYENVFLDLAHQYIDDQLLTAKNDLYAINLNIQYGTQMRYECHVDSNPLQGLLYVTPHPKGFGGELVVSNNPNALGVKEINADCEIIYPESGILYLFNASYNPHYVRPLTNENDIRISVPMNFYTPNSPESSRPHDLNDHLF